jgi:hypothetical protein
MGTTTPINTPKTLTLTTSLFATAKPIFQMTLNIDNTLQVYLWADERQVFT